MLLLSTVFQLLQLNHRLMKLGDIEGLLNSLHSMYAEIHGLLMISARSTYDGGRFPHRYEKSHRVVADALGGAAADEAEVEEALHLQLEAMAFYLQVLFDFFAKLEPGAAPPKKGVAAPLGSDAHVLLIGSAAEFRLVSFCLHVLRDYLAVHDAAVGSAEAPPSRLAQRTLRELTPAVVSLLQGILAFHEPQFVRHLPGFYPLFVELMHCDAKDVRQTLRDIFSNRIGNVLHEKQQGAVVAL